MAANNGGKRGETRRSAYDKKHPDKSGTSGKKRNTPDVPHPRAKSRGDAPVPRDKKSGRKS